MNGNKPQDLLEFLRRARREEPSAAAEAEGAPADAAELEKTPRLLIVRRSQVIVAAVATGLGVLLAFLLGLGLAGGDEAAESAAAPTGTHVWVLRVATYNDNETGRIAAKTLVGQLRRVLDNSHQIHVLPLREHLVVGVGGWLRNPRNHSPARELARKIAALPDENGDKPFADALFWRIGS